MNKTKLPTNRALEFINELSNLMDKYDVFIDFEKQGNKDIMKIHNSDEHYYEIDISNNYVSSEKFKYYHNKYKKMEI